jgi:hypothetical protein
MNQIEVVKRIAESMYNIGGIPSNEEFYAEFNMRVKEALGIRDKLEVIKVEISVSKYS